MSRKFDFYELLDDFFSRYLEKERHVTRATLASYADSLGLFIAYLEKRTGRKPSDFMPGDFRRETIIDFLDYLEQERGNSIRTRNARLACLRSFFGHVSSHMDINVPAFARIASIRAKKCTSREVDYLFPEEIRMLADCIDRGTAEGRREYLLLVLLIQTGMRVSELCKAQYDDMHGGEEPWLQIHGKGRKERSVRLTRELHGLLSGTHEARPHLRHLFPNYAGRQMTRHGVCFILNRIAERARRMFPQLGHKQISPHVLRHTNGMLLLWGKNDLVTIARWLGHSSTKTTEIYVRADIRAMDAALQSCSFLDLDRKVGEIPDPVRERLNDIRRRCRGVSGAE